MRRFGDLAFDTGVIFVWDRLKRKCGLKCLLIVLRASHGIAMDIKSTSSLVHRLYIQKRGREEINEQKIKHWRKNFVLLRK